MTLRTAFASLVALALALPFPAAAQAPFAEGVVLVGFKPNLPLQARAELRALAGFFRSEALTRLDRDAEKLILGPGRGVQQAIEALRRNPNVRFAEPDYLLTKAATSNDSYFTSTSLWGMYGASTSPANPFGSNAAAAWAAGRTGSKQVYVGVIDEGIQITHPDLAANTWVNPFENCTDGIDNDGNGYIDDCHGWDFYSKDKTVFDAGGDAHGTHVAGTIGGVGGNGAGVAGVNWAVTMISGKFLGPAGGYTSDAIKAVDYFTDLKTRHGLNIVATSNSWGGGGFSQGLLDAINRGGDQGILFIAAAGNSTSNNDAVGNYPSNYQCTKGGTRGWDCVIAVASINSGGALSSFSSYGATTVDIGAPGEGIISTVPSNSYANYSGTSMATPHVSGAAALCASINPALTGAEIRQHIMSTAAPTPSLSGKTVTGGRLDVGALANACAPSTTVAPTGAIANLAATGTSTASIGLSWSDTVTGESRFEIQQGADCQEASFATVTTVLAGATGATITGLQPGTTYCFRVAGANAIGSGEWSNTASATTQSPPAAPTGLAASLSGSTSVALQWADNATNETGYEVERATGSGSFTRVVLLGANVTSHTNTGLSGNTTYRYRVRATGSGANSSYSNEVSIATPSNIPAAPTSLTASLATNTSVTLRWADNATNESGYEVERATGTTGTFSRVASLGSNVVTYTNSSLAANTTYRYRVRAISASGNSTYSGEASIVTPPPLPTSPSSVTATLSTDRRTVTINWNDRSTNEQGFEVWRLQRNSNGLWPAANTTNMTRVSTVGANIRTTSNTPGAAGTFRFYVRAYNAGGFSGFASSSSTGVTTVQ